MHKFIITYLFVHCLLTHLLMFPFKLMHYVFEQFQMSPKDTVSGLKYTYNSLAVIILCPTFFTILLCISKIQCLNIYISISSIKIIKAISMHCLVYLPPFSIVAVCVTLSLLGTRWHCITFTIYTAVVPMKEK